MATITKLDPRLNLLMFAEVLLAIIISIAWGKKIIAALSRLGGYDATEGVAPNNR